MKHLLALLVSMPLAFGVSIPGEPYPKNWTGILGGKVV